VEGTQARERGGGEGGKVAEICVPLAAMVVMVAEERMEAVGPHMKAVF
jgi:hypothetical protein